MKTKYWILLLAILLAGSLLLNHLLQNSTPAGAVRVLSEGELLYTLSLNEDQTITVKTDRGTNVITIQDSKVAVTEADCPDGYCMDRGFCNSGAQIVCLPNRLVLQFTSESPLDGVSG